eukprot:COSAG01_NODE_4424_length_5036_cov_12.613936_4_plen_78_part_00
MRVLFVVPPERDGAGVGVAAAMKLLGVVGWVQVRAVAQRPLLVLPLCKTRAIGFSDSERVGSRERETTVVRQTRQNI